MKTQTQHTPKLEIGEMSYQELKNLHGALLEASQAVSDGINTAVDNDEHWTRKQLRDHLFALQSIIHKAIAQAEGK